MKTGEPLTSAEIRETAESIAEAVRLLNHATLTTGSGTLEHPADIDAVLHSVASAALRLGQLMRQLGERVTHWHAQGALEVATTARFAGDPGGAADQIKTTLGEASDLAVALHHTVAEAALLASTLGMTGGDDGG